MLNDKMLFTYGKFMSYVLRHQPDAIGLSVDEHGWASIDELIQLANAKGKKFTREILYEVVERNNKKRFVLSDDGSRIRAAQGHSIDIDLQLDEQKPPEILYHGTAKTSVKSINHSGLSSRSRNHVHLSLDEQTAKKVGSRHGNPVILVIKANEMWQAGYKFYLSENGVWLTEAVPAQFIDFPDT